MAMTFQGTVEIKAPRDTVYAFLTNPEQVTQCAPDVQKLEPRPDGNFRVTVKAGVGFVKATFALDVVWLERDAPRAATARARGNAPGSAVDLTATMRLADTDGGTRLDWQADVLVSGAIASVGARLLQGAANKITTDLFACVKTRLEAPTPPGTAPPILAPAG